MSREQAEKKSLEPLVKIVSWATCGVEPSLMGLGPIPSIQEALSKAKWKVDEVEVCATSTCNVAFTAGDHVVSYETCDQYGGCSEQSIDMTVNQINDAPLADALSDSYDVNEEEEVANK